nr:hypothetical protein [uncultured Agathobaculum sp.]
MLKLLKYEWKACARICLPLCGLLLLLSAVTRVMMVDRMQELMYGIPTVLISMLYFAMIVTVFVVTTVILIQRFYKNLLGDEGYLMFTLPVTVSQHIWSKTIIALAMSIISMIALFLSIGILGMGTELLGELASIVPNLLQGIYERPSEFVVALEALLWLLILSAVGMLFIYLCIALGHLAKKHRVLMAVVWYFVLTTVFEFLLMFLIMGVGTLPLGGFWMALQNFFVRIGPAATIHVCMIGLCIITAAVGAAFFLGTRYILKNKLNLE